MNEEPICISFLCRKTQPSSDRQLTPIDTLYTHKIYILIIAERLSVNLSTKRITKYYCVSFPEAFIYCYFINLTLMLL